MAQRYCSQVYCKPSQELQTGDIQLSLETFYKVTGLKEVREVFPSLISRACFLHPCWETISFEKHCWKHLPFIFAPSQGMISLRKLLLLCRFSFILWIFQQDLCKRKWLFSWKAFFALLKCTPSSYCLSCNCSVLLLFREWVAHSASSELQISPFSPFLSSSTFLTQLIFDYSRAHDFKAALSTRSLVWQSTWFCGHLIFC